MSNASIQQFQHEQFGTIRAAIINDEPWFLVSDICNYFGVTNRNRVLQQVDEEDKGGTQMDTPGGRQTVTVVNESGLYAILFYLQPTKARGISDEEIKDRYDKIKRFKRWVTHDVLPSIRKTGAYVAGQENMTPEQMLKASMQWLEARISEQEQQIELQNEMISVMRPKALFADAVSMSATSIPIGDLAKVLKRGGTNIGRNRLMRLMRNDGYLMKQRSSKNMPTQKAMNLGLLYIEEKTVVDGSGKSLISKRTMVTGKGQTYFHRLYCISPQLQLPLPQLQLPL